MTLVLELELWSEPGMPAFDIGGHDVAEACRTTLNLPRTVVLGLSFVPCETDVENLGISIRERELSVGQFREFCAGQGLDADAKNPGTAMRFLAKMYGQPLAWLHFPFNEDGKSMAKVVATWARQCHLVVVDPERLSCPIGEIGVAYYWHEYAQNLLRE